MHLADVRFGVFVWKHHGFVHVLSRGLLIFLFCWENTMGFARITHTNGQADTPDRRTRRPDQTTGPDVFLVYPNASFILSSSCFASAAYFSAPASCSCVAS